MKLAYSTEQYNKYVMLVPNVIVSYPPLTQHKTGQPLMFYCKATCAPQHASLKVEALPKLCASSSEYHYALKC